MKIDVRQKSDNTETDTVLSLSLIHILLNRRSVRLLDLYLMSVLDYLCIEYKYKQLKMCIRDRHYRIQRIRDLS